jgi:hypothetical protein
MIREALMTALSVRVLTIATTVTSDLRKQEASRID